jgi:electron transfer flavoprotein alpha/beta subunit
MKILALIKVSMDVSEIKVDPASRALRLAGVPERVGHVDKTVVEAGVRMKTAAGDTLQVLCLGPATAKDGFKDVLAMGADEVFLIEDPFAGQADAAVAVRILEAAIRKLEPFDLVLTGFASDDGYTYQVGPRLAERLGTPLVSYVRELSAAGGSLKAERDQEDGMQSVTTALPAVVSIAEEAFPPRRTTLMDALKAKKKPVNIWTLETLGLDQAGLEAAAGYAGATYTGVVVNRKGKIWKTGDLNAIADELITALVQENVLKGGA